MKVDVNENIQMALLSFENDFGVRPNRIIMGYVLVRKLLDMFYSNTPYKEDEFVKYYDISVSVDYENPNKLEVGYMVNHTLKAEF